MTVDQYQKRRDRLRKSVRQHAASLLVTHPVNVSYLTGFTGEDSYLWVSPDGDLLLSDPRFEEQIGEECPGLPTFIRRPGESLAEVVMGQVSGSASAPLGIEAHRLSVDVFDAWQRQLPDGAMVKTSGLVEQLRMIKDKDEVLRIRRAVDVAQRVFVAVRAQLSARHTERDIADEIERLTRVLGGSGCAFKTIVAAGPRAALPHAIPGEHRLGDQPFVLIDWGAVVAGYRSDLTRVLVTSKIPAKFARIYEVVLAAQQAAIAALKPGVPVSEIDRVAREVVAAAGHGPRFNHGLGHGIGLDIHEAPRLGAKPDLTLEAGMVVTVEPGVYYPGWGGIRIEDDVLITSAGHEVLSSLSRELHENCVDLLA